MNIQIFGTRKCNASKKTERFFKERKIPVHFIDLREDEISEGELENISQVIPIEDLINKDGKEYKKMNLQYMRFDIREKLLEYPILLKTPITRWKKKVTLGYEPEIWKEWIKDEASS